VEAPTQVQGGRPQREVQEEAQGKPPPRVAFRRALGGLSDKDRVLHFKSWRKTTLKEKERGEDPPQEDSL